MRLVAADAARACGPRAATSMPQLHSQRMQAVGCQSVARHVGAPFVELRAHQVAQLAVDAVERLGVAPGAGHDERALDRGDHEHRQLAGARGADALGREALGEQRLPARECRGRALVQVGVGVAGLDGDRDDRAAGAEVGAEELLAVVVRSASRAARARRPGSLDPALRCSSPAKSVASRSSCSPPAGEVVVDRAARRSAVGEHVVDARRARALLANEQGGRDDHPVAGARHQNMQYVIVPARWQRHASRSMDRSARS